ncbi:MAG: 2-succinyl-5-enolpyruvyl-6-hydroxy-3-cyclohexene-1-carboxylic-acid synthase [Polyangiaceae bacterium]|nr:2-succinyl-5-enolpyruvyl-6-hydroxy-3-cyclohexene-1-carboxylic-acid synthase [Polyangiaceae bacterium]
MSGWLASAWARTFVAGLAHAGVRLAVVSPGSRSTPLVLALLEHGGIEVRVVLDERAAGFLAVGWAKVTGAPAALVCTSGSAGAHYLPALVEARHAGTPVVAVTADRPPEERGCGASQTIDQLGLFGAQVVAWHDLGPPERSAVALASAHTVAVRAVCDALTFAGPVHVNAPFRKPLEPAEPTREERALLPWVERIVARPPAPGATGERRLAPDALAAVADALARAERPLVVAGPLAPALAPSGRALHRLLEAADASVYAETASQLRHVPERAAAPSRWLDDLGAVLEAAPPRDQLPDVVLQLGPMPVGAAWERCFSAEELVRFVIAPAGWHDPTHAATAHFRADLEPALVALADRLSDAARARRIEAASPRPGLTDLAAAGRAARDGVALGAAAGLGEGAAVRAVAASLRDGELLVVGNGLPIRELDRYAAGRALGLVVVSQRGAAGIDGLVAGGVGAALAARRPGTLLIGDLALLHDLGSLGLLASTGVPLRVVVIDNGGGRIFEELPVADHPRTRPHLAAWTTPHGLDLADAGRLARLPTRVAASEAALADALAPPPAAPELLVVRVDPTSAARDHRALQAAVAHQLASPRSST